MTPLHEACRNGHLECVILLLEVSCGGLRACVRARARAFVHTLAWLGTSSGGEQCNVI